MTAAIRVLYVYDEPGLLDIGKLFLEREGVFAVDTLTSSSEALTHLKTEHYDAIISDYQMPDMDGIAFLRQLKASGNTSPFIIFTGRGRGQCHRQAPQWLKSVIRSMQYSVEKTRHSMRPKLQVRIFKKFRCTYHLPALDV